MKEVKPTSERYVQRQVVLFLRRFGWFTVNTSGSWKSARGMSGFPDVIAFKNGVTLLVECKATEAKLRDKQQKFRSKLFDQRCNEDSLHYCTVHAGEFEPFIYFLGNIYNLNDWDIPDNFTRWRPKL